MKHEAFLECDRCGTKLTDNEKNNNASVFGPFGVVNLTDLCSHCADEVAAFVNDTKHRQKPLEKNGLSN